MIKLNDIPCTGVRRNALFIEPGSMEVTDLADVMTRVENWKSTGYSATLTSHGYAMRYAEDTDYALIFYRISGKDDAKLLHMIREEQPNAEIYVQGNDSELKMMEPDMKIAKAVAMPYEKELV